MLQEKDECYRSAPLDIQIVEHKPVIPPLPTAYEICEPCMQMVSYLTPKAEPLKVRSEQSTLYIEYAVGATAFKDDYKNNGAELQKLKDILSPLTTGDLVTFKAIKVCGYASPDGSAKTNDRVASQRAASFSDYLKKAYSFPAEVLKVTSAGEDWETLIQMLKDEKPAYADKALEIINKYSNVDTREARLKSGLGTATYRTMLNDLYLFTYSLPIKQMFIFLCRKMDEYTIVSFHTIDENICQFVFPELIDRLVVCSFERYAMLHTIRYDAIQRSKQSIKEAGNPEMFLGIL